MSGYQYYEFQAMDTHLDEEQQEKIQNLSSRAVVTARHATFSYDYGDFPGDTVELMTKYFDVGLYMADWGVRCLMFRFPYHAVDINKFETYCIFNEFQAVRSNNGKYLLLEIYFSDDALAHEIKDSCQDWCGKLLEIRTEIINGDYRPLYLAWLSAAHMLFGNNRKEEQTVEPPVPEDLQKLSSAQQAFAHFFKIDESLIAVAAGLDEGSYEISDLSPWVDKLSPREQHDFLVGFSKDEPNQRELLNKRLRELAKVDNPAAIADKTRGRTIAELHHAAIAWSIKKKEEEERRAAERRQRELESLIGQEDDIWKKIQELIKKKTASAYNEATNHLQDLHDLAQFQGKPERFTVRMQTLAESCANQPAMLNRMREANLM